MAAEKGARGAANREAVGRTAISVVLENASLSPYEAWAAFGTINDDPRLMQSAIDCLLDKGWHDPVRIAREVRFTTCSYVRATAKQVRRRMKERGIKARNGPF
jgi:hypothetical protein